MNVVRAGGVSNYRPRWFMKSTRRRRGDDRWFCGIKKKAPTRDAAPLLPARPAPHPPPDGVPHNRCRPLLHPLQWCGGRLRRAPAASAAASGNLIARRPLGTSRAWTASSSAVAATSTPIPARL
ncbi:hypothetical protein PVAP13_8NG262001 [Panicum virgatum]|uniref:Uncharacterized protein n=1 Tax=Panicum virgatum TaxID=38727 RepID=A0A8T0PAD2_PANVG|nr:hypothetical protein PVAP13_8NG262001 [Panicum virgatum]